MRPVNIEVLAIKAAQQKKLGLTNYWSTWRVLILLFPIPSHFLPARDSEVYPRRAHCRDG